MKSLTMLSRQISAAHKKGTYTELDFRLARVTSNSHQESRRLKGGKSKNQMNPYLTSSVPPLSVYIVLPTQCRLFQIEKTSQPNISYFQGSSIDLYSNTRCTHQIFIVHSWNLSERCLKKLGSWTLIITKLARVLQQTSATTIISSHLWLTDM